MLAEAMGCDPIILTGMDLAVEPGGKSHAEGTANVSTVDVSADGKRARLTGNLEQDAPPLIPVEAYDGGQTFTFTYFHQILLSLEKSIANMPGRVIDATEGGAKKQGAVQMALRDALQHYAAGIPVKNQFDGISPQPKFESPSTIGHTILNILKGVKEAQIQLKIGLTRIQQWSSESQKERCLT